MQKKKLENSFNELFNFVYNGNVDIDNNNLNIYIRHLTKQVMTLCLFVLPL